MNHSLSIAEHDMVSALRLHATPSPLVSISLLGLALAAIAVAWAANRLPLGAATGAVAGMFAWLALLYNVIIPYRARRAYRQQRSLHQLHHFRWDNQFLYFRCASSHGRIRWADFTRVKENGDMLLLYRSGALFNMFPKRCFPSRDSLEDFRACLARVAMGQAHGHYLVLHAHAAEEEGHRPGEPQLAGRAGRVIRRRISSTGR